MSVMSEDGEKFLTRWSRLKQEVNEAPPAPAQPAAPAKAEEAPLPDLPPVEELTFDSNFRDFLHPKVDEDVKRAALKKLFSDPHFNVMDGLDTYIDDYSKGEELPAEMLAQLKSAQKILRWARNEPDEEETEKTALPAETPAPALENQAALVDVNPPAPQPSTTADVESVTTPVTADVASAKPIGKL